MVSTAAKTKNLWEDCGQCDACGPMAGYQSVPLLYAGSIKASIVVIGQNPGEIKDFATFRLSQAQETFEAKTYHELRTFYQWDFSTSYGAKTLAGVFGSDWLTSGEYMFTNAVRCRTRGNYVPTKFMIDHCRYWTTELLEINRPFRKGIVYISRIALEQGIYGSDLKGLRPLTPLKMRWVDGWTDPCIYLRHYRVWAKDLKKKMEVIDAFNNWVRTL